MTTDLKAKADAAWEELRRVNALPLLPDGVTLEATLRAAIDASIDARLAATLGEMRCSTRIFGVQCALPHGHKEKHTSCPVVQPAQPASTKVECVECGGARYVCNGNGEDPPHHVIPMLDRFGCSVMSCHYDRRPCPSCTPAQETSVAHVSCALFSPVAGPGTDETGTTPPAAEPTSVCKLCGKSKHHWQVFCGAACCAKWEAGERPAPTGAAPESVEIFLSQSLGWQISRTGGGIRYVLASMLNDANENVEVLRSSVRQAHVRHIEYAARIAALEIELAAATRCLRLARQAIMGDPDEHTAIINERIAVEKIDVLLASLPNPGAETKGK